MTLKLIAAPQTEPLTTAEAKVHLRVAGTAEDTLIDALIQAAREQAEGRLNRPLITQTWERVLDGFPCAEIELGKPPVQSITSIVYIDENGDTQTLATARYSLDADTEPGFVLPAIDTEWPETLDTANAVRVRFVVGFGAASAVPASVKAWMLLQIGALYRNREAFATGAVAELPGSFADRLLEPYRIFNAA